MHLLLLVFAVIGVVTSGLFAFLGINIWLGAKDLEDHNFWADRDKKKRG